MENAAEQQAVLDSLEFEGDMGIETCDEANIPVNIFISEEKEEKRWRLSFDVFCPRKLHGFEAGTYYASSPEPLRKLVEWFVKPLYDIAGKKVAGLIDGTEDSFYYWEKK